MRREVKPKLWPAWKYGPNGEAELFEDVSTVPAGWQDVPVSAESLVGPAKGKVLDRDGLIEALTAKGIEVDPRWPNVRMKELLEI